MINLIFASDYATGVIGNKGELPWGRLPNDLKFFKQITEGHDVVMGRKTFESIGKPLPNRLNVILSRTLEQGDNYLVIHDIDELHDFVCYQDSFNLEVFIIGGAELFAEFLGYADRIYHTVVHGEFEGDTFFPWELGGECWEEWVSESLGHTEADEENPYACSFFCYTRIIEE